MNCTNKAVLPIELTHETHTADKSHEVCRQTYVSSCVEFIHGSDKLYTCDVCNMTCSDASALSIHKQLHTGVKSFSRDLSQTV